MSAPFPVGTRVMLVRDNYNDRFGKAGEYGYVIAEDIGSGHTDVLFDAKEGERPLAWFVLTDRLAAVVPIPVYDAYPKEKA